MRSQSISKKFFLITGLLCVAAESFAVRYTNNYNYTWTYAQGASVPVGSIKVPMTQLQLQLIGMSGSGTYTLISLSFNTSNTTNPANISSARLWYNSANNLNGATQKGATITSVTGIITFTFNQTLNSVGPHYYWLTYDISSTAASGNYVTSLLQSIVNTDFLHPSPFSWLPSSNPESNRLLLCANAITAPATPVLPPLPVFTKPTMGTWVMSTGVSIICQPNGLVYTAGSDQQGEWGDGLVGSPFTSGNQWITNYNPNITGIVQVDNGINTNVVLRNDQTVWAWGDNWWGKIGNGTYGLGGGTSPQPVPQKVVISAAAGGGFLTNVVKVMSGDDQTVALTADHKVYAWGYNSASAFGPSYVSGTWHPSAELLTDNGINPINWAMDVDCGDNFITILRWDSTVWTMGYGMFGQLGNGQGGVGYSSAIPQCALAPGTCNPLQKIIAISAGRRFMMALSSTGNVYAWGLNNYGQTGTGIAGTDVLAPKKVLGPGCSGFLSGIVQIAASGDNGYALDSAGNVYSWGADWDEQLADGPGSITQPCPQLVATGMTEIQAGLSAVLARKSTGEICAAGNNWFGNFGLGGPYGCCSFVDVFTCVPVGVVLPVELLSFTGYVENSSIVLEWSTASEVNNDYFTVEKSLEGVVFYKQGEIKGAGNSTVVNSYSATDQNPFAGINYYRIRQTDFDGTQAYSQTIAINYLSGSDIVVFPNPASTNFLLSFWLAGKENVQINLFDISGRKVKELFSGNFSSGQQDIQVEVSDLLKGIYFCQIISSGKISTARIIIQ